MNIFNIFKEEKNCIRHKLLVKLDNATANTESEKSKLDKLISERKGLVEHLIFFAEDKYFKRYRINETANLNNLIERDSDSPETVNHWYRCMSNINPRFNWTGELDIFSNYKGVVNHLDREDFKDVPETYELVRFILTVIQECDNAIIKQREVYSEAEQKRRDVVIKIEKTSRR